MKHGAKVKRCSSEGCTNHAQKGGVCWRHGAYRNTNDESTAFGSEFELNTATQSQPNHASRRPAIIAQRGGSIPGEVAICQEIYEV